MLEEALEVVEAVRDMRLIEKNGRTSSELAPLDLAHVIERLRLVLESFDSRTGTGVADPALLARPDFATPPQLEDEGAAFSDINLSPDFLPKNSDAVDELETLELEAKERLEAIADGATSIASAYAPSVTTSDLELEEEGLVDGIYIEGDESTEAMELAIGALDEKLNYAVKKVGWSPKLRALATSARLAHSKISIEYEHRQMMIKMPAAEWSKLSLAYTEAAIDQNVSVKMPSPTMKSSRDRDLDHDNNVSKPRPPTNW